MGSQQVQPVNRVDALVVGAGLSGLYETYRLKQAGLDALTIEAAPDIGGVWYWNRYPGARVDSHFPFYQYFFSQELWDSTEWQQRFPDQPEIERYFHLVCEKFGLRERIIFNTRVAAASFDEGEGRWLVTTDAGTRYSAQFLVLCSGGLSDPKTPGFPGEERFAGTVCHTSRWPREGVELEGKRVGVVGTAATGIQVIQTIAPIVGHLTVFQRTPNYAVAMKNYPLPEDERRSVADKRAELRERAHSSFGGMVYDGDPPLFEDVPEDQRQARLEALWSEGSMRMWGGTFSDELSNDEAAAYVSEFVRGKIRARIKDPAIADIVVPTDYYFGSRRVPLENGYFDVFNRDNVTLVDLRRTPITEVDETGIVTTEARHDLDVLIFATGFDAGIGAINSIDIRGRGNRSLKAQWDGGVTATAGMMVHGFPNMFMTLAPFAPGSAVCNMPICAEQQVEWISNTIEHVVRTGGRSIEPRAETEQQWMEHHRDVSEPTTIGRNVKSWYRLTDAKGNSGDMLAYLGGVALYRDHCEEYRSSGYAGFVLT